MFVSIYHQTKRGEVHYQEDGETVDFICGIFNGFCKEHSVYELAYTYETEQSNLENIYHENQGMINYKHDKRSLSVGDVVVLEGNKEWPVNVVLRSGFSQVDMTEEQFVNFAVVSRIRYKVRAANEALGREMFEADPTTGFVHVVEDVILNDVVNVLAEIHYRIMEMEEVSA